MEHSAGESAADHMRFKGDDLENEQCFVTTNESREWLKDASKWSNGSSMPVIILPHKWSLSWNRAERMCKSS